MLSQLTIIIPVYNEQEAIPLVFPEILAESKRQNMKVIAVDDGSKDESVDLLNDLAKKSNGHFRVIHHKVNKGYGGALKTGICETDTPYLLTMDADGQHSIQIAKSILRFAMQNDADLVVGNRGKASSGWFRDLGKYLIRAFANIIVPINGVDLNSGYKLYSTDLAKKYIKICPEGMALSDIMTMTFLYQKNLVLDFPISIQSRIAGKSTINFGTAVETFIEILNIMMLFNPLKFFLPASFFLIFLGFLWGIPFALQGRGVSVGAMLSITIGSLLFALGLIAHQLSEIRRSSI